jgi:hypothetical protein
LRTWFRPASRIVLFLLEQRETSQSFITATEALHHHIRAIIQMADDPVGSSLSFDAVSHIKRLAGSFHAPSKVAMVSTRHQASIAG